MNEFLRILRKIVRPMGYDLKRHHQYTLRPIKYTGDSCNSLKSAKDAFDQDCDLGGREFKKLNICLRTCLRDDRNIDKTARLTGASIAETTFRCVKSLVDSANAAQKFYPNRKITIICLEDHSDAHYVRELEGLLSKANCEWKMITTAVRGQGPSLHEQFTMARNSDDSLWYFVEDDYLHYESAIQEMWDFYEHMYNISGSHLMIHPQEHENLYKSYYPSYIVAGKHRHWRTTSDATHAFFTHSEVVQKHWQYFENTKYVGDYKKRHLGSEAKTTNKIFEHIPGFSPLPGLACHLQFDFTIAPFFNWKTIWDKYAD